MLGLTPQQFRREWEVLAGGTLYTFQAAIPHLKAAGGGVLLTTSAALFGDYGAYAHPAVIPAYGAAKGAQEMLVKTTAMLHARDGIRVCAVQPGFTLTPGAERTMALQGVDLATFTRVAAAGLPMGAAQPEQIAEGFCFWPPTMPATSPRLPCWWTAALTPATTDACCLSGLLRKFRNMKTRLPTHGGVAHPRNSCGYCCGVRLALSGNPSFSSCSLIYEAAH